MSEPRPVVRSRQTKIVATLGPASTRPERLRDLFLAGADVFRLNFSHGTHAEHAERLCLIRELESEVGRPIGVLADLQGPKLRIGHFAAGPVSLVPGQRFRVDLDPAPGTAERVQAPHPELFQVIAPGQSLLLDDGNVRLKVVGCGRDFADTVVETGTALSDHKALNVPDAVLPLSPLTAKDRADLRFALDLGVDWIALSFVQRPEDVAEARELTGGQVPLVVKMEKPSALEHLDALIEMTDAMMVARGDLGVEMPLEEVPSLQKRIVQHCRRAGKPVIVATQMLDSMMAKPMPTRAETSDVATAVYDGADAVMLSGETAAGQYPVEAVRMMDRIASRVERDPLYRTILDAVHYLPVDSTADAITAAARQVAQINHAVAIVTYSVSGATTRLAAAERPGVPIVCLSPEPGTARRMALCWGVHPIPTAAFQTADEMAGEARRLVAEAGLAWPGQWLVITAGVPFGTPGKTNILYVTSVDG